MSNKIYIVFLILSVFYSCQEKPADKIDRFDLVTRNNPMIDGYDSLASLSIGNGEFAFTTDLTGLQTFYKDYEAGVPLGTMSNWGWHTNPNKENYKIEETWEMFEVEGRQVPYRHQKGDSQRAREASNYFRENPHRLHLGIIGLVLLKENGESAIISDIKDAKYSLDMWTGKIFSEFVFDEQPVKVEVYCHQDIDLISAKIESPLIETGQLAVQWEFPYGIAEHTHGGYDFNSPEKHQSVLENGEGNNVLINRNLDNDRYQVAINWQGNGKIQNTTRHRFILKAGENENTISFSCLFSLEIQKKELPVFEETKTNSHELWEKFWQNGGAVDFSECTDLRAKELERRVVLSQYLTKIQSSGSLPPAETGLTYNSWFGKFHLEMHWWHIAHFAQWQRPEYMLKQLDFYNSIFDVALQTAKEQGYQGVRWPKMVGTEGENSPSSVGSYLIWQQPHIIWFGEQLYRQNSSDTILNRYKDLIFSTANFMADYPVKDSMGVYNLVPPLIPAQEHWNKLTTHNPPFELAYWYWGLSTAQKWKERLNLESDNKWEEIRLNLATPDIARGVYLGIQGADDSYINPEKMRDHPMVLGAYGILPEWNKIDPEIMRETMHVIAEHWDWASTWGWDYPMAAMSAARLVEPELALEFLLKDVQKNTYLKNGHNYQDERLRIYLPGNGGLLTTVAMMCAGWEGCIIENPGFPNNGKWNVKWENLSPAF
ncbi:MAG: hypothetical protein HQ541_13710 [Mariniphaga sp.]|nr:hypothetical protein [Mariniphaga sp.]